MHLDHSQGHENLKSVDKADVNVAGVEGWEMSEQTQTGVRERWCYLYSLMLENIHILTCTIPSLVTYQHRCVF